MTTMRPIRTFVTVLLLASLALTGCRTGQADEPTTPAARPPASTAAPATTTPAGTGSTTRAPPSTGPTTQDPVCAGAPSWDASPKQVVAAPVTAELYQVRAATHRGCDRVLFDLNGLGRVGYLVGYVPVVHADPSDRPVLVAGVGAPRVTIGAPDFRESGHQAWRTPWQLGRRLAGGGTTLREVRFAGTFWLSTSPTRLSMVTDWSPLADGGGELQRRVGRLNARSCCCRSRDWAEQASRACYPRHQDGEG